MDLVVRALMKMEVQVVLNSIMAIQVTTIISSNKSSKTISNRSWLAMLALSTQDGR